VVEIPPDRFEQLVADALDSLPTELGQAMDNVAVMVEDDPPEEGLFGLYEGTPLTERDDYGGLAAPDVITIYRNPICAFACSEDEVVDEVRTTVIHEIAHHFGIDDDRLDELGWA
jgi:predicted Zn-dependent protease with MMP-like domain